MMVSRLRALTLFTFLTGALTGCNDLPDAGEESGGTAGAGAISGTGGANEGTGGASTGGAPATGGGSSCEGVRPAQAYQCAGWVSEREVLGFNSATLVTYPYYYACGDDYYYGSGGYASVGGTTGVGGAATGGMGGEYYYPDEEYVPTGGTDGDGDWGMAGSTSTGGIGMGGSAGGMPGGGGGPSMPPNSWCSDLVGGSIAGVSYAAGPCTESQLRLPLHFQEPEGWYKLRVFAGNEACERGTLLFETAGYGVQGSEVEVPVSVDSDVFISLELTAEDDWSSVEAAVELLPLSGNE